MTNTPHPGELLVAIINEPRDFHYAGDEHWYRIPVRRAPPRVGARYLAFYHTAACGEDLRWRVCYYAAVQGYRIVSRCALLPDEPDHPRADDLYYRVALGPLLALPRPIPSHSLRRVTFIASTLGALLGATEINDLWDRETARDRLWQALRAREVPAERGYLLRDGVDVLLFLPEPCRVEVLNQVRCAIDGSIGAECQNARGFHLAGAELREVLPHDSVGEEDLIKSVLESIRQESRQYRLLCQVLPKGFGFNDNLDILRTIVQRVVNSRLHKGSLHLDHVRVGDIPPQGSQHGIDQNCACCRLVLAQGRLVLLGGVHDASDNVHDVRQWTLYRHIPPPWF